MIQDLYPSRAQRAQIIPRRDPVVHTPSNASTLAAGLKQEQLEKYAADGFLIMPNLFTTEEAQHLLEVAQQMATDFAAEARPEVIREPGQNEVRSVFLVHKLNDVYAKVAADPRLLSVARQILGSEVYIHQSRLNLKPSFSGKGFNWHSDFETWHVEDGMPRMRALSCIVLLTENNEFNGPLLLVPGSHQHYVVCVGKTPDEHYKDSLRVQDYGVPDNDSLHQLIMQGGLQSAKGHAGTVVFFDCNTMHGSSNNISPWPRSNLFFVYNSIENKLEIPYCGLKPRPDFIANRSATPLSYWNKANTNPT